MSSVKRTTSMSTDEFQRQWIRPDLPMKCTWHLGVDPKSSPHHHIEFNQ